MLGRFKFFDDESTIVTCIEMIILELKIISWFAWDNSKHGVDQDYSSTPALHKVRQDHLHS